MDAELRNQLGTVSAALRRTAHALDRHSRAQARDCGLTGPQALLIAELAGGDCLSIGELAQRLALSQAATSELSQRLEARGLLRRLRAPSDRRRTELRLTASGEQALVAQASLLPVIFRDRFAALSAGRRQRLVGSLLELAQLLNLDSTPQNEGTHVRNSRRDPIRLKHA